MTDDLVCWKKMEKLCKIYGKNCAKKLTGKRH